MSQWGEPRSFRAASMTFTFVPHVDGDAFDAINPNHKIADVLCINRSHGNAPFNDDEYAMALPYAEAFVGMPYSEWLKNPNKPQQGVPDESNGEPTLVTADNLDQMVERYSVARGGELNENTNSEARFVAIAQYRGAYILSTGLGPVWIGIQNASARWTEDGHAFASVRSAIQAIWDNRHPTAMRAAVYYFDDSSRMLRWVADRIDEYKRSGDFLLHT